MEDLNRILSQTYIDGEVAVYRLLLSLLLGALIGVDREKSRQAAGLRTHILICTGSTLIMLVSAYVPQQFLGPTADPGRIVAQVISGIGFLGAGAIFRLGVNVKGLTTAASIWVVAAIGITVGAGFYEAAIFATFLLLFVLVVLNIIEKKIFPFQILKVLRMKINSTVFNDEIILQKFKEHKIKLHQKNLTRNFQSNQTDLNYYIYLTGETNIDNLIKDLSDTEQIIQISIENKED